MGARMSHTRRGPFIEALAINRGRRGTYLRCARMAWHVLRNERRRDHADALCDLPGVSDPADMAHG